MTKAERRRFRKWARRLLGVNQPEEFLLQIPYIRFLERIVRLLFQYRATIPLVPDLMTSDTLFVG
jgi:hypothetical protein